MRDLQQQQQRGENPQKEQQITTLSNNAGLPDFSWYNTMATKVKYGHKIYQHGKKNQNVHAIPLNYPSFSRFFLIQRQKWEKIYQNGHKNTRRP
jgi:hypothetical protein